MAAASERLRSRPENAGKGNTLEQALQSNLKLQAAVVTELEQLAQKKAENRRTAARPPAAAVPAQSPGRTTRPVRQRRAWRARHQPASEQR